MEIRSLHQLRNARKPQPAERTRARRHHQRPKKTGASHTNEAESVKKNDYFGAYIQKFT